MSENAKQGRVVISPGLNILYTHVESKGTVIGNDNEGSPDFHERPIVVNE